jgi:hypothetical protein
MNRTARIILTEQCYRSCVGCCNSYPGIIRAAAPIQTPRDVKAYKEVVLTGGEPMTVCPTDTIVWARALKSNGKHVYVYLSDFRFWADIDALLPWVDGITWTLHAKSTLRDVDHFTAIQAIASVHPQLSFRLGIHPDYPYPVSLRPSVWSRVQLLNWTANCPAPEHEDLFIRRSLTDEN